MNKYEVREAKNGQFYWVIIAENGEILATSETYTTKQGAMRGIEAAQDEDN